MKPTKGNCPVCDDPDCEICHPKRGGKRPGSGRRPLATGRKITGSVNLHPDNWKRLKHAAKAQGVSVSAMVDGIAAKLEIKKDEI